MRLLVLGASGGCGQWVTRLAADRGHQVTAVVRPGSEFAAPRGVDLRRAEVTDPSAVDAAVGGHDAIVSCLGLRRAGRSPWSPLRSPPDLTARVARLLVPAMHRHGVSRVVAISAAGVGDSLAQLSWPVRKLVAAGNVRAAYRDLAEMEATLDGSGLDWLVLRPVTLTDGPPRRAARPVERYRLTSTIRRSEVAAWMVSAAECPGAFTARHVTLGA